MKTKSAMVVGWIWLLVGTGSLAAGSGPDAGGEGETTRALLAAGTTPAPMMVEIKAALDSARLVEAELLSALHEADSGSSAEGIRTQLAAHQVALKIEILQIQARHVRAEGREELAQLIEARLESYRDKRPPIARAAATD